jgi:hypothetical protein
MTLQGARVNPEALQQLLSGFEEAKRALANERARNEQLLKQEEQLIRDAQVRGCQHQWQDAAQGTKQKAAGRSHLLCAFH